MSRQRQNKSFSKMILLILTYKNHCFIDILHCLFSFSLQIEIIHYLWWRTVYCRILNTKTFKIFIHNSWKSNKMWKLIWMMNSNHSLEFYFKRKYVCGNYYILLWIILNEKEISCLWKLTGYWWDVHLKISWNEIGHI